MLLFKQFYFEIFEFKQFFNSFPTGQLTICERERIDALKIVEKSAENGTQDFSFYIPKCDEDGRFEEVQCLSSNKKCWCVDRKTGNEVDGVVIPGLGICQKSQFYMQLKYLLLVEDYLRWFSICLIYSYPSVFKFLNCMIRL